ncbi:hypothetical protein N9B31_09040 [Mariniblastus sp.]|nr:hypothetical protein [Mariniblastus sp.]
MQIPELLHSLTLAGLSLATEADGKLSVVGPVKTLTDGQRRSLKEHAQSLLELRRQTCLMLEQAEREALLWADLTEAQGLGEKAGNEFLKMASVDYETWLWNRVGTMETPESLDSFSERFEKDILEFEVFRQIADNVRQLISNRRALLVERERHNQKSSEPGAVTPNPL